MFEAPVLASLIALQDEILDASFFRHLVAALAFAVVGVIFFAIAFLVMIKATPFSVRKEIEDDQNTALAIVMASVIIGIAIIVGMAVQG
jgi:putative membrane protein